MKEIKYIYIRAKMCSTNISSIYLSRMEEQTGKEAE